MLQIFSLHKSHCEHRSEDVQGLEAEPSAGWRIQVEFFDKKDYIVEIRWGYVGQAFVEERLGQMKVLELVIIDTFVNLWPNCPFSPYCINDTLNDKAYLVGRVATSGRWF